MIKKTTILLLTFCCFSLLAAGEDKNRIDLSGTWQFALDPDKKVTPTQAMTETVTLPGTTDTNKKGYAITEKGETTHLSRLFSYKGRAWYRRTVDIPESWNNKAIYLHLERTKPTEIYVDGEASSKAWDISTPQVHEMRNLTSGHHEIAIMVDNSSGVPEQVYANSHAYTEDTQTNWNGIIGDIYLEAVAGLRIEHLDVRPDAKKKTVSVTVTYDELKLRRDSRFRLTVKPVGFDAPTVTKVYCPYKENKTNYYPTITLSLGNEARLWDEFSPNLYELTVEVVGGDDVQTRRFGLVDFKAKGQHFYVNGRQTFLRGKHDACVWPLTAHVAMDIQSWKDYLGTCQAYGLNHIRFHSWCPPEAAFVAADELGIYLQPELPFWGDFNDKDMTLMSFLRNEGYAIFNTYSHHPSFRMFALGNELWGSIDKMSEFIEDFRDIASDKLFTFGSNYYLGYQGVKPGMDYFTTCRVGGEGWGNYGTHTRGSFSFADAADGGMINHFYPNTQMNFQEGCALAFPEGSDWTKAVPVISHETAQFQTYPDYSEIKKYTGVLYPYNMEVFRDRLDKAGMLDQAEAFHKASGLWSLQLYKQDIEMDLRTKNMAGFQLLDLQDYPGQGSAYVGILDAFMDSKGLTSPQEWRHFCSEVVPLFVTDRLCYTTEDTLTGRIQVANYSGKSLKGKKLFWHFAYSDEKAYHDVGGTSNMVEIESDETGLMDICEIHVDLSKVSSPKQCLFHVTIVDDTLNPIGENAWNLWVYPFGVDLSKLEQQVIVTDSLTEKTAKQLENGKSVLLMPGASNLTVGGLFQTDYWNYRMFKTISENNKKEVSPGTLGILCDPQHPIFRSFPTEMHTNWQWFPVIKASHPMMLDNTGRDYRPIVQVIDNIERNHKLGLIFEFAVGKGKLLVCMADLDSASSYPEGRQFYRSVLEYMTSDDFAPTTHITLEDFQRLMTTPVVEGKIGELNNISPY